MNNEHSKAKKMQGNTHKPKREKTQQQDEFKPMSDYELERFCNNNPHCGCDCMNCPAFAANYRYNNQ